MGWRRDRWTTRTHKQGQTVSPDSMTSFCVSPRKRSMRVSIHNAVACLIVALVHYSTTITLATITTATTIVHPGIPVHWIVDTDDRRQPGRK